MFAYRPFSFFDRMSLARFLLNWDGTWDISKRHCLILLADYVAHSCQSCWSSTLLVIKKWLCRCCWCCTILECWQQLKSGKMWWTRNSTWWWTWLWCGRFSTTHVTTLDLDLPARPSVRDLDHMYWHIWVSFCRMVNKVKFSLIFWKLRCDLTVWFLSGPGPIIV